ncbi:MAG: spiro-SPASM protein [Spirochaetes bacterium]|nr:spiro-SPASM protein [Spirochaetota bacterium]
MKSDILLYVDAASSDDDLMFIDMFLPDALVERLGACGAGTVYFSVPETYSGRLSGNEDCLVRSGQDDVEFWKRIFEQTGSDHICKIHAESPFLDPRIISDMIDHHLKYLAEFTYSENLPPGFSCEIVSRDLISAIPDISEKTLPLAQVIRANINHFDIELYYRDPDLRDKRISFLSSNRRDRRIMEEIYRATGAIPAYDDMRGIIDKNPEVLFAGPSYLEIELSGKCDLDCVFCYRKTLPQQHGDMDPALIRKILDGMKSFDLPYTVCFGGSGEPLMHPNAYEIFASTCGESLVESVIVETNGLYADANYRNFIMDAGKKIKTIVNINGIDADTYKKLHNGNSFDQVRQNILDLQACAGERLYIQIMKINETEPFLDAYYDYWERNGVAIILQKQNTFLGKIADRRYSDLSPLDRIPCWHLQRDLYITADGTVCFCKQDIDGTSARGSVASAALTDIWKKKRPDFMKEYAKDYQAAPDCASCDEWYTFNC